MRALAVHHYIYLPLRSFYAGQEKGPEPHKPLCIAQTALLAGITPMWATAVLVLLYNMILVVNNPSGSVGRFKMFIVRLYFFANWGSMADAQPVDVKRALPRRNCLLCHGTRYVAQTPAARLARAALLLLRGQVEQTFHGHDALYICHWHRHHHRYECVLPSFSQFLEFDANCPVYLAVILYRNWHGFRHAGRPSHVHGPLLLRVFIFGGYIIFGFAVNVIFMVAPRNLAPDMYAATSTFSSPFPIDLPRC